MGWASIDGSPRTPVTGPGSGRDNNNIGIIYIISNAEIKI